MNSFDTMQVSTHRRFTRLADMHILTNLFLRRPFDNSSFAWRVCAMRGTAPDNACVCSIESAGESLHAFKVSAV